MARTGVRKGAAGGSGRLYEQVSKDVSLRIGRGEFAIGQRLPAERDLAQKYGVSRPTVREAIIALELDGMVEVRMGSGVYVVGKGPLDGHGADTDIGPFELLEARQAIEGEVCAMAATHITSDQLAELSELVDEMQAANVRDVVMSEDVDRRFHMLIAESTQNSALISAVEALWAARERSAQHRLLSSKAHAAGIKPGIDEHTVILKALQKRDPDAARKAMRTHLGRVIEALLEATETHEIETARARIEEKRKRYAPSLSRR